MAGTVTHLAIADRINSILGNGVIKNLPLFFGGNIAPDAIHAKQDYQRSDKKHSHLCDGVHLYGYGFPEIARLFKEKVNNFIKLYYQTASDDKDLYFGYIVHILVDDFYMMTVLKLLENHLKKNGINTDDPGFRKNLADEISDDPSSYNYEYIDFFKEKSLIFDISAQEYDFTQNVVAVLEAAWDYEVKDYININQIDASKLWVINSYFKKEQKIISAGREQALKFIELAAIDIIMRLSCKDGIVKLLS